MDALSVLPFASRKLTSISQKRVLNTSLELQTVTATKGIPPDHLVMAFSMAYACRPTGLCIFPYFESGCLNWLESSSDWDPPLWGNDNLQYTLNDWELLKNIIGFFSSVQSLSCVWLFATPWTTAHQASLSITNSRSLLKLMSFELVIPSNHLILCPLLLLPSIFPNIRVFSNESALRIRWPKYWSFGFNISPSNEHPGLISFWMDWLELLEVQGTLKSFLQHHSSKA